MRDNDHYPNSESESEDEYEEDLSEILDEMYDFEESFDLKEKETGKYYLGMYMNIQDVQIMSGGFIIGGNKPLFFGNAISVQLFFKYKYSHIQMYLKSIIMCRRCRPLVDIMQLIISEDGLYLAIIKTYWISIIQRHWKKIMNKKREYIKYQKSFQYIRDREIGVRNSRPNFSIYGMLSCYKPVR
jgi:hypothetical protein